MSAIVPQPTTYSSFSEIRCLRKKIDGVRRRARDGDQEREAKRDSNKRNDEKNTQERQGRMEKEQ